MITNDMKMVLEKTVSSDQLFWDLNISRRKHSFGLKFSEHSGEKALRY
jgi:hypothetical protein